MIFKFISAVIIVFALFLGISVFFKISEIEISGGVVYTEAEIIAASGVEFGDNLFLINKFTIIDNIFKSFPYISEVTISRAPPNKLVIGIEESYSVAVIGSGSNYWIIDKNCKLLEKTDASGAEGKIIIKGITLIQPVAGEKIALGEAESPKVSYLSDILTVLLQKAKQNTVTEIDMSNISNPKFDYEGRFTVKLGEDGGIEKLEYKFSLLDKTIEMLGENERGTINLSIDNDVHFDPD